MFRKEKNNPEKAPLNEEFENLSAEQPTGRPVNEGAEEPAETAAAGAEAVAAAEEESL